VSSHDQLEDIWEGKNLTLGCSGDNGQGILASKYGDGEYLDTKAIGKAHLRALPLERPYEEKVKRKLQIQHLELGGFVVDSKAIKDWFDPEVLVSIKFLDHCIDAGFSLDTEKFRDVKIEIPPGQKRLPVRPEESARVT